MKKTFLPLLLVLVFVMLTGCGSSVDREGQAKTPSGSSHMKGQEYQAVVQSFEDEGFVNIRLEKMDDLVTGWLTKDGEVEKVSVGGDESYSPDKWMANDTEVVITYHSFPEGQESEQETPATSSEANEVENQDIAEEQPDDPILTIGNSEELKSLLLIKGTDDNLFGSFAEKYKGREVEFDGSICYLANHGKYDTRYDLLLQYGDYVDENTVNTGPLFKLEDAGLYDMGIEDLYLPAFVAVGNNVSVTAEIVKYDNDLQLLYLKPVLIASR